MSRRPRKRRGRKKGTYVPPDMVRVKVSTPSKEIQEKLKKKRESEKKGEKKG